MPRTMRLQNRVGTFPNMYRMFSYRGGTFTWQLFQESVCVKGGACDRAFTSRCEFIWLSGFLQECQATVTRSWSTPVP